MLTKCLIPLPPTPPTPPYLAAHYPHQLRSPGVVHLSHVVLIEEQKSEGTMFYSLLSIFSDLAALGCHQSRATRDRPPCLSPIFSHCSVPIVPPGSMTSRSMTSLRPAQKALLGLPNPSLNGLYPPSGLSSKVFQMLGRTRAGIDDSSHLERRKGPTHIPSHFIKPLPTNRLISVPPI